MLTCLPNTPVSNVVSHVFIICADEYVSSAEAIALNSGTGKDKELINGQTKTRSASLAKLTGWKCYRDYTFILLSLWRVYNRSIKGPAFIGTNVTGTTWP